MRSSKASSTASSLHAPLLPRRPLPAAVPIRLRAEGPSPPPLLPAMALLGAAVLQLMAQVTPATGPSAGPLAVGTDEHLLVDDHFFTPLGGTALAMHPPAKGEMLIRPDKPWERILWWYVTILKVNESDYRLYCASRPTPQGTPYM